MPNSDSKINNAFCRVVYRTVTAMIKTIPECRAAAEALYGEAATGCAHKAYERFIDKMTFSQEHLPDSDLLPLVEILSVELVLQQASFFDGNGHRTIFEITRRLFAGCNSDKLTGRIVKDVFENAAAFVKSLFATCGKVEKAKFSNELLALKIDYCTGQKIRHSILREIFSSGIWRDTSLIDKAVSDANQAEYGASRTGSITHVSKNIFVDLEQFVMPFLLSSGSDQKLQIEWGDGVGAEAIIESGDTICICGDSDAGKTTLMSLLKCNLISGDVRKNILCLSVGRAELSSLSTDEKLCSFIGLKLKLFLSGADRTTQTYDRTPFALGGYALVMYRVVLFCDDFALGSLPAVAYLSSVSKDIGVCFVATATAGRAEALALGETFASIYTMGGARLSDSDMLAFVEGYYNITACGAPVDARNLAREFLGKSAYIKAFIDSPFFLSLAASIFQIEKGRMPETRFHLLEYCIQNLADDVIRDPEFPVTQRFEVRRALAYLGDYSRIIGNKLFLVRDVADLDAKEHVALGVKIGERRTWLVDKVLYKGDRYQYRVRNKTLTRFLSSLHIVNQYQSHADKARCAADLMYNNAERDWLNYVYLAITVGSGLDPSQYIFALSQEIFTQLRFKNKKKDSRFLSDEALDGVVELSLSSALPNHVFDSVVEQCLTSLFDYAGKRSSLHARIINREKISTAEADMKLATAWRMVSNLFFSVQLRGKEIIFDKFTDIALKAGVGDRFVLCFEFVIFFKLIFDYLHVGAVGQDYHSGVIRGVIFREPIFLNGVKNSKYLTECMNVVTGKVAPQGDWALGVFPFCPVQTLVSRSYFREA